MRPSRQGGSVPFATPQAAAPAIVITLTGTVITATVNFAVGPNGLNIQRSVVGAAGPFGEWEGASAPDYRFDRLPGFPGWYRYSNTDDGGSSIPPVSNVVHYIE